jgi:hypothetical protein
MPYHNLDRAHRRLMAELPADSPYRLTESPSLTAAIVELWRRSWAAGRAAKAARRRQTKPGKRSAHDLSSWNTAARHTDAG